MHGAVDFRLVGVPVQTVLRHLRATHNGGVGFYPQSGFLHADAPADLVAERLPGVQYIMPEGTYLTWLDFSNLYLTFSERSVTTNDDNFNGRYKNTANLTVLNLRTNF